MSEKVSIVIPVHNGAGKLEKTVKQILKQSYKNIEVVLVENFSEDNSLEICNALSQYDSRVKVFQSFERGTTYARKKGILSATGDYITFSDQDDSYINRYSIENMYNTIKGDNSDVCQFGFYLSYGFGYRKKWISDKQHRIIPYEDLMKNELKGLFLCFDTAISPTVWSKIYKGDILRSVAPEIDREMYSSEDLYLNLCVFGSGKVRQFSVSPQAYYVWKSEVGFSSSAKSREQLFLETDFTRMIAVNMIEQYHIDGSVLYELMFKTLYYYREFLNGMINDKTEKNVLLEKITKYEQLEFILYAKNYFKQLSPDKYNDVIAFMISDYTPEELYSFAEKLPINSGIIPKLRRVYRKIRHA